MCMLLTALGSMPWQGHAQTIIKQIESITPRAYGYVIGDVLEYRLRLETDSSFRLDPESLPAAGRINVWLELRPPLVNERITGNIKSYDIVLAISESLKGYAAPKAHIHSAGVSPVSVRIYNEI